MRTVLIRLLPIVFLWIAQFEIRAQATQQVPAPQAKYKVEGTILDSLTRQPLPYTTIVLFAEKSPAPITGSTTNDKGSFKLEKISAGVYVLVVEPMGYTKKVVHQLVVSDQTGHLSLGPILVVQAVHQLQEVTVTGQAPVYENKIDRLVYNPEREVMGANGDATELLRKVPMLTVDLDGNVALRGNRSVRVLIDGKPVGAMSGNIGDILQAIPAAQIKSIEVITSPSARYDAEGSGGIINIITRKKNLDGISGSVNAGIGTRQLNSNVSVSGRVRKLSVDVNAGINNKWPRLVGVDFYSYDASGNNSSTRGTTLNTRLSNNASATLQYDFDEHNSISSTFRRTSLGYNDDLNTASVNNSVGRGVIDYTLHSESKFAISGFDWSGDFLHRFGKKGAQLSIAAQWSQNTSTRNYRSLYSEYFASQKAENLGVNNEYTAQADYTAPLGKVLRLEAGVKNIFRSIDSNYNYFILDSLGHDSPNMLNSNNFTYQQQVYAGYFVLQATLPKDWTIQVGNRLEKTRITGTSEGIFSSALSFANNYTNSLPSVILVKKLKGDNTIQLNYNERIQRPSLQYLNPFRNTNDPLNQSQGTPELSPEHLKTIELAYNTIIKTLNLNAALYYKNTSNIIESFVETVPYTTIESNGTSTTRTVALTHYGNIGLNNSFGANIFSSINLGKSFSLRGSFNAYTYRPQVKEQYSAFLNPGTFLQYNGFASVTCKLPSQFSLETLYSFQSKERTFQGTAANLNIWNIGIKKTILNQRGSISIVVVNLLRNNWDFTEYINTPAITQYSNLSTPFRSFNLNIYYKIGGIQAKSAARKGVSNDDLKEHSN